MHALKLNIKQIFISITNIISWIEASLKIKPHFIKSNWSALLEWKLQIDTTIIPNKGRILIVAMRNDTWIEWSIYAAIRLYNMGYQPVVLYSEKEIPPVYARLEGFIFRLFSFWKMAKRIKVIEFVNLDEFENKKIKDAYFDKRARELSYSVAAKNLMVEEFETDFYVEKYNAEVEKSAEIIREYMELYAAAIKEIKFDRFICPSGVIGQSLSFREVVEPKKIPGYYVEAWCWRAGHLIWGKNHPPHFYNIDGWVKFLGPWDEEKEKHHKNYISFQEKGAVTDHTEDNEWLEEYYSVQKVVKSGTLSPDIQKFLSEKRTTFLLGTNVIGDSSTLFRKSVFKNQKEWLRAIITFFAENKQLRLIIRIHPDELRIDAPIKMGLFVKKLLEATPCDNILLVDSDNTTNTYDLIEHINAGLVWLSTVGVDMTMRDKRVIIAAKSNYSSMGFAKFPDTPEEYFECIREIAASPDRKPTPEMKLMAKYYQLLVFKEMSLEATGKKWLTAEYRVASDKMPPQSEQFYKMLAGEYNEFAHPYIQKN